MSELDKIKFQKLEKQFEEEFKIANNKQILFSGPFGSGKTTFLKDFAENNKDITFLHIYPVNYSLHNNIDIYEILKYDIILELISNGCFELAEVDRLVQYIYATCQTAEGAFHKILNLFSKTGKQLSDVAMLLGKSAQNFSSLQKELADPLLSVKEFGEKIEMLKAYEHDDFITTLIHEKIQALEKEVVLIVDDLDTIDPEHLFRLLSIFRAHIDHQTNNNKFGFNKIIFVADVNNIKTMFAHRFGSGDSFNGYISKLSSRDIFYFNSSKELYNHLYNILSGIKISISGSNEKSTFIDTCINSRATDLAIFILANLIEAKVINLRDLKKPDLHIKYGANNYLPYHDRELLGFNVYPVYALFKHFINDGREIETIFEDIKKKPVPLNSLFRSVNQEGYIEIFFNLLIELISDQKEFKSRSDEELFDIKIHNNSYQIKTSKMSRRIGFVINKDIPSLTDFFSVMSYCFGDNKLTFLSNGKMRNFKLPPQLLNLLSQISNNLCKI